LINHELRDPTYRRLLSVRLQPSTSQAERLVTQQLLAAKRRHEQTARLRTVHHRFPKFTTFRNRSRLGKRFTKQQKEIQPNRASKTEFGGRSRKDRSSKRLLFEPNQSQIIEKLLAVKTKDDKKEKGFRKP